MTDNIRAGLSYDLTSRLMRIIFSWRKQDTYELQNKINQTINDYDPIVEMDIERTITRRDALRTLVLFACETCYIGTAKKAGSEEILAQCAAAITACWYLRKGKELALANDAVSTYIASLQPLAEINASKKSASALLTQCYLLKATLSRLVEGHDQPLSHLEQAQRFSGMAEDPILQVLALRTLAATYSYGNKSSAALTLGEKAAEKLKNISAPPKLQSFVYAGLANYQAQCSLKNDSLKSLEMANKTFTEESYIWIDHPESNMWINTGMVNLHLGDFQSAITAFGRVETLPDLSGSSDGKIEATINSVVAEVQRDDRPRDLDRCIALWQQGINGAKALKSEQWFSEAKNAHRLMCAAWPTEQRIKALREQLAHW
ncbi:hypothetical protein KTT_40890 [Tengunoibacter tsumagoiensis]|uniref:MalT-like TPR region domain-containing protein n=2 Tax=Tengunoibacter tsumagoiensis TaxID=2014871 RepID=A0A402A545_9CHLR|nr:hypothetical protein KTT_40350 [Tengunoibacter tsumagoiensis]GCE14230.1 hypothetical protein KTT_40890 [Tengunoibacter tsumagoiensis]